MKVEPSTSLACQPPRLVDKGLCSRSRGAEEELTTAWRQRDVDLGKRFGSGCLFLHLVGLLFTIGAHRMSFTLSVDKVSEERTNRGQTPIQTYG